VEKISDYQGAYRRSGNRITQILHYQNRARVLTKLCNCGFLGNEGSQRMSLSVKS
jgi:hypothetical protein